MQKLWSHKVSDAFVPRGNYSPGHTAGPWGSNSLREQPTPCSPKKQPCSPKEQMCLIICLIIIFAYEFRLSFFQLQSCISPQNLSNDRLQAYIKTNMRWMWLLKNSECMFPRGIWAFPQGKFIIPCASWFFPWEQSCSREKEFKLPWGTIMSWGKRNFFSPQEFGCSSGQLKPCFFGNMVVPRGNLNLASLGSMQLKPLFTSRICFHPFCLWMKKII